MTVIGFHAELPVKLARPAEQTLPVPNASAPTTVAAGSARWSEFEKLGLKPQNQVVAGAQRLAVGSYRLIGFAILTIIVVVLVGYIATSAFFFCSKSWIMPVAVSNSDEKVVSLKTELAAQQNQRDKIVAELEDTDRAIWGSDRVRARYGAFTG
jgi:hypothetical protein